MHRTKQGIPTNIKLIDQWLEPRVTVQTWALLSLVSPKRSGSIALKRIRGTAAPGVSQHCSPTAPPTRWLSLKRRHRWERSKAMEDSGEPTNGVWGAGKLCFLIFLKL